MTGNSDRPDQSWPQYPASVRSHRVGVMRCSWGATSFDEHCRLAAGLGAGYVEDFSWNLAPETIAPDAARDALEAAGIPLLLLIAPNLDCADIAGSCDRLARDLEHWRRIGLTTFVTLRAGRGPTLDDFLRTLEAAARVVRAAGLTPVTQNHRGGVVESPQELAACVATGVALHFDTQQWPMAGHDALAAWDLAGPQVRHVHLGERDAAIEGAPFGTGITRMRELLQRMHATGYRGAMSLETEYGPNDASALPIVAEAMAFVDAVLEPLGALGAGRPSAQAAIAACAVPAIEADWGRLHWIASGGVFAGCDQTLGLVTIHPGRSNGLHRHPDDQEVLYVQRGRCRHICGEQTVLLEAGDVLFIPAGQAHGATNIGEEPLELVVTYPTGARSFESLNTQEVPA
jgi:quercetin dioxygenase-like cupin family protein/sugar phosphate isomerase/epimerase